MTALARSILLLSLGLLACAPDRVPPGPPGQGARLRLGEGESHWVDVFVAGQDAAARTRCIEALAHAQRQAERLRMDVVVARECSLELLPSLIAVSGEATTLLVEEDPTLGLSLERIVRGEQGEAEAETAPMVTVVRVTRFERADACRAALDELRVAHETSTRDAQDSARAWLDEQRADLEARRTQACSQAEARRAA